MPILIIPFQAVAVIAHWIGWISDVAGTALHRDQDFHEQQELSNPCGHIERTCQKLRITALQVVTRDFLYRRNNLHAVLLPNNGLPIALTLDRN